MPDSLLSLTLSNISNNNNISNNKEDAKISIIVKNINKQKSSSPYRRDTLFWLDARERFTYLKMSSYSDERLRNFSSCLAPQTWAARDICDLTCCHMIQDRTKWKIFRISCFFAKSKGNGGHILTRISVLHISRYRETVLHISRYRETVLHWSPNKTFETTNKQTNFNPILPFCDYWYF
mgnify:CR=1 FL=1